MRRLLLLVCHQGHIIFSEGVSYNNGFFNVIFMLGSDFLYVSLFPTTNCMIERCIYSIHDVKEAVDRQFTNVTIGRLLSSIDRLRCISS